MSSKGQQEPSGKCNHRHKPTRTEPRTQRLPSQMTTPIKATQGWPSKCQNSTSEPGLEVVKDYVDNFMCKESPCSLIAMWPLPKPVDGVLSSTATHPCQSESRDESFNLFFMCRTQLWGIFEAGDRGSGKKKNNEWKRGWMKMQKCGKNVCELMLHSRQLVTSITANKILNKNNVIKCFLTPNIFPNILNNVLLRTVTNKFFLCDWHWCDVKVWTLVQLHF